MTIKDLPCGAKIKFGRYHVEDEAPHEIRWIKVDSGKTVFITEFIEDIRCFDAAEPENCVGSRDDCGNNRYSVSNIDQFLNSTSCNWYSPRHEYDEAPSYTTHAGFLSDFEEWEVEAIEDTEVCTALSEYDSEDSIYEIFTRKIFLPSKTELAGNRTRGIYEGDWWEYFRSSPIDARATPAVTEHSRERNRPTIGNTWYYHLRSPDADNSHDVGYVDKGGGISICNACTSIVGVRPALTLNPEILVSEDIDADGCYEIIPKSIPIVEFSEEELFSVLF